MDAFVFVMGLTLLAAGLFLFRDYVQFLAGVHTLPAKVVSIQQVFLPGLSSETDAPGGRFVSNGFYPIVEYHSETGPISFTAIDKAISGRFHVGDKLRLRISKTRRSCHRHCKSITALLSLLLVLCVCLFAAALETGAQLSAFKIIGASVVIALCFATLILYTREQDEQGNHRFRAASAASGPAQLCLCEPTAFEKWKGTWQDHRQKTRIRGAQAFGAMCLTSACALLAVALRPFLLLVA